MNRFIPRFVAERRKKKKKEERKLCRPLGGQFVRRRTHPPTFLLMA
jgi:hypothetical protein